MSKRKKGLSAEEKRAVLLEVFHEKQQFYQLKEVEKIAVKEKGLKEQLVKEILQSLVDDGIVEADKIGTSMYYWSFPDKKHKQKQLELETLHQQLEDCDAKMKRLQHKINESKKLSEESSNSVEIFDELRDLQNKETEMQEQLNKLKQCDKTALRKMKRLLPELHEAANRWTDNVFALKTWSRNRFNVEEALLEKQFQIPPDLDYLE